MMSLRKYDKIIELSRPLQDKRDDIGHFETVADFAEKLCNILSADESIVVPAAILHDTGYHNMPKERLTAMMEKRVTKTEEDEIKKNHMIEGAKVAENILSKVKYDKEKINVIKSVILRHDEDDLPESTEEKILQDADKLWRYSSKGFFLDVKRRCCDPKEWHAKLTKNLEMQNYFYLNESKQIAKEELSKRMSEILKCIITA